MSASQKTKKAFTLVELIIVISILSILAIIAFMGFSQFMGTSRDSVRMTDIKTIFNGLNIYKSVSSTYPFPDQYVTIVTGSGARHQGIIGETTRNIIRLSGPAKDPKFDTPYYYTVNKTLTGAQLMGFLENSEDYGIAFQPISNTVAQEVSDQFKDSYVYLYGDLVGFVTDENKNPIGGDLGEEINVNALTGEVQVYLGGDLFGEGKKKGSGGDISIIITSVDEGTIPCNPSTYSGYQIPMLEHAEQQTIQKTISVEHASQAIGNLTIQCNNGNLDFQGATEFFDIDCDTGYARSGESCVPDLCSGTFPENAVQIGTDQKLGVNWTFNTQAGTCTFVCEENYTYQLGNHTCNANTKTENTCNGSIIPFAHDNNSSNNLRTQTWNGTEWNPIKTYEYSSSSEACTYRCDTGYTWNPSEKQCKINHFNVSGTFSIHSAGAEINICGSMATTLDDGSFIVQSYYGANCSDITITKSNYTCSVSIQGPTSLVTDISNITGSCIPNSKTMACTGKVENAHWNTVSSITQTWNGATWLPTLIGEYSTTISTSNCVFVCDEHYTWNDGNKTCDIEKHTVTFDANGGNESSNKIVSHSENIGTLPTPPTKTGYSFNGWFTATSGGTAVTTATVVTGNVTYYAQWSLNSYTVSGTFGSNGADATVSVCGLTTTANSSGVFSITASYGANCNDIQANKVGYVCTTTTQGSSTLIQNQSGVGGSCGLTQNGTCGTANGKSRVSAPSTNLCSVGTPSSVSSGTNTFTWTCNGLHSGSDSNCSASILKAPLVSVNTPEQNAITWNWTDGGGTPTKNWWSKDGTNWSDIGIYTAAKESSLNCNTIYSNRRVKACDDIGDCTVSVTLTSATTTACPIVGVCGSANGVASLSAPSTNFCSTGNSSAITTTIGSYTWSCIGENGGGSASCSATRQYTVAFDGNGGTAASPASKVVNYNTAVGSLATTTRAGYTFNGWFTLATGGTAVTTATVVTGTVTYYAQWIQNGVCGTSDGTSTTTAPSTNLCSVGIASAVTTNAGTFTWSCTVSGASTGSCSATRQYTVTFNSTGGSSVSNVNINYGTTLSQPTSPSKTEYSLLGWYKDAGLTTIWNFTNDIVTSDTILYAKWTEYCISTNTDSPYYSDSAQGNTRFSCVYGTCNSLNSNNGVVKDSITGLYWKSSYATYYNWDSAKTYCKNLTLGTYVDWRLPDTSELFSIADYGRYSPSIDTNYFASSTTDFWTSSSYAGYDTTGWVVFDLGNSAGRSKYDYYNSVRCVHGSKSSKIPWQGTLNGYYDPIHNVGSSYLPETRFSCESGTCNSAYSNNGVVKDSITGLHWQSGYPNNTYNWTNAQSYCAGLNLGGSICWRVPNIKELQSLVDNSKSDYSINTSFFASTNSAYWSSSVCSNATYNARKVGFINGNSTQSSKTESFYVRCVR